MGRQASNQRTRGSIRQRYQERSWEEMSVLDRIYVSSEVIMYSIADIQEMTGWSETTVQKLFNDPRFPAVDYGKRKVVENHALMQFFSVRREKAKDTVWR